VRIAQIKDALEATVVEGQDLLDTAVDHIYASDLMSDVLAFGKPNSLLLTGLASQQAVISAYMAEFAAIVLIRGKTVIQESARIAREHDLVLLSTPLDMYPACVRIDSLISGRSPDTPLSPEQNRPEELLLSHDLHIAGRDFTNAGIASTTVKSILKKIGLDPVLIRRVAIATYEGEMNVVMHADEAKVILQVSPVAVDVVIDDRGKGIPDVDLALQEGFTTATDEMRAMGFGSGMGLPNIKRNADELDVQSEVDVGTRLTMRFVI